MTGSKPPFEGDVSTVYAALEVSGTSWILAVGDPSDTSKAGVHRLTPHDVDGLPGRLGRARERAVGAAGDVRVKLVYEAGHQGFWLARRLEGEDPGVVVCDPASLEVVRRKKKVRTDRIDARRMVRAPRAWDGGDRDAMSRVRVPTVAEEDRKRLPRRRERPVRERRRLANAVGGLTGLHGLCGARPERPGFRERPVGMETGYGTPLPPEPLAEIGGMLDRLELVAAELKVAGAGKHPCWKSSPDPAFFPFFPGSVFGCPGPFHSVPHRGCRQGTPEAPAGETPAGPKVIRFRAGPRRSVRVSGGGHRRPVLPHPPVAEKGVGGHDQPAHDCHEGDPVWPAPLPEPLVQLPQVRGATAGRHRRHVDDVPRPPPSTADVAPAPDGPAVAGEGGHAQQGGGLPVADGAQLRHPRDQGRRGDGADARHRGQDAVAVGELRRSGDRHADPPLKGRDGGVDILEDPADLRAGRPRADLRQDGPQLGPLVHEPVAEHQHVAELVDGGGGRLRGLHVRERGPEGRQYPGVHPVRPPKGAGGLREVPGLAGVHHEGGETPGVQRLQQRPVHAPRRLHDGLHGAALPEEAGDPAEAVAVVGGREVPSVDVDVECTLAYVDSGDYGCHALPLLSSR